jgi:urate oxidase
VLPTDTQKQTAYAYAKETGLTSIEEYGLALARHFVHDVEPVQAARIELDEYAWERAVVDGAEHDYTFIRKGQEVRTAAITVAADEDGAGEWVVGGLKDLVILKSTGSEFAGFLSDPYTILEPTHDRVMATSLVAQWRFTTTEVDWDAVYTGVKTQLVKQFAVVQSLALQQTLYHMGKAVLEQFPQLVEVRLSAPNKHHFVYDLSPFGLENPGEVFHADDRPYGLIQATVTRSDAPDHGPAWDLQQGWLA